MRGHIGTLPSLGLVLALAALGCGDGEKAVVKGRVTLDGKPVESGAVQFFPEDNKSPTGKPGMIENGTYHAPDVPIGKVRVVINSPKVIGKHKMYNTADSPVTDKYGELIPAKYNTQSTLVKDIKAGTNEIDFELSSK